MSADRVPVLFDTDIGSDIDDAVCLAYLLRQPRCELVGVTTVTGEPEKRAMMADTLCRAAGADVPIRSGLGSPILVEQKQGAAPQAEALSRWEHSKEFAANEAVPFMREVIRSRPGEVTLLAVGPLTNVGLLFASDPGIPAMLKRLVLMCGAFLPPDNGGTEWNASGDPHATAVVFGAPVGSFLSVGLDVTSRCRMDAGECRRRFRGELLEIVASFAEVWFEQRDVITFHDPLAASLIFEPDLCGYEAGRVEIDLSDPGRMGRTVWTPGENGPHTIAAEVDAGRFFEHYFDIVA